jgi:hypothetical protein
MISRLALCLLLVAAGGRTTAQQPAPAKWLEVFTPLPGARMLCNQHVTGGTPDRRVEIAFTLYATIRSTGEVARFYAEAHKVALTPGVPFVVKLADGRKVLSVFGAADDHPACGVAPNPQEPTVIMVSEMTSAPKDRVE